MPFFLRRASQRAILDFLVLRLYNRVVVLETEGEIRDMRLQRRHNNQTGFTLIELLVVMVILGLLAALVAPKVFPQLGKGKQAAAKAQIELFSQALDQFRLDVGRYPTTQEGLNALVTNPGV